MALQLRRFANSRKLGWLALAGIGMVAIFCTLFFKNETRWHWLIEHETELRESANANLFLTALGCVLLYAAVTGLSIPVATLMTLVFAWLLGFWPALFVVSFGATSGATLAFLASRYFFREAVRSGIDQRFPNLLEKAEADSGLYLFMLRLTPAVPFFVVNLLMSLTNIRARDFWWISQLGMLPLSIVYVYAGAELPSLRSIAENGIQTVLSWRLMLAFCLLGIAPLLIKKLVSRAFSPAT